jgi:hypothetical protein
MAVADARKHTDRLLVGDARFAPVGYLTMLGVVVWWTWRALHDPLALDTGLAYSGGQVAWATGHPEHLYTWISTPFLGLVMALVSRITSSTGAAHLITALNLLLVVGSIGALLYALRDKLAARWWWVIGLALCSFGPMMSSVWWKQFNIISLVLTAGGFELIRRRRGHLGGAAIGLGLAIKPLAIAVPVLLVCRRDTRRAGIWSIVWFGGLNIVGQIFMAIRAHSISALNIFPIIQNFAHKSEPSNFWSCVAENFAPGSLLCRLVGGSNWTLQHFIVWGFVAILTVWIIDALRGRRALEWDGFSFACAISVMLSPIAWSHYQIMLAPLFVVLVYRFSREGASIAPWCGLLIAFLLASLMWQPFGTIVTSVRQTVTGHVMTERDLQSVEAVAEFAQYVLVITGILWYYVSPARLRALGKANYAR